VNLGSFDFNVQDFLTLQTTAPLESICLKGILNAIIHHIDSATAATKVTPTVPVL
jgi:hypothetical protein